MAIERLFPDDIGEYIISIKSTIPGNASDNLKFQAAHTIWLKDKVNLHDPLHAQREYMKKIKRYFLQDYYSMALKDFHDYLVGLNDLLPFNNPLNTLYPLKLTPNEVYESFCQSISAEEEIHAKANGFIHDKRRFFHYLQSEFDKKTR